MAIMVSAMLVLPSMDAISKYLSIEHAISPMMVVFTRFAIQACLLFVFLLLFPWRAISNRKAITTNLARGMLVGAAVSSFFTAIKYMPLADAIAIFFVEPLIVLLISPYLLGEEVGWRRRVAALIGFGGAVLVIQPSYELFGPVSLLPLVTATLFALYLILTRKSGTETDPYSMQFYSGIGAVLFCSIMLTIGEAATIEDFAVTIPTHSQAIMLLGMLGLIATVGHLAIVFAFSMAPASILAPFQYVEIIGATALGLLIFGDFPGALQWVGIAIIVGSGLYTFWRERKTEKETISIG